MESGLNIGHSPQQLNTQPICKMKINDALLDMQRYQRYLARHGNDDSSRRHNSTARICERDGWILEGDIHEFNKRCHLTRAGQAHAKALVTYFGPHGEGFENIVIIEEKKGYDLHLHVTFQHERVLRCSINKVIPSKNKLVGNSVSAVREESATVDDEIEKFIARNMPWFSWSQ